MRNTGCPVLPSSEYTQIFDDEITDACVIANIFSILQGEICLLSLKTTITYVSLCLATEQQNGKNS